MKLKRFNDDQKEFSMKDLPEVTFKTSNPERLTEIVKAIGELGNPGHTFSIVLDPNNSDSKTEFTWDGDGSDYIELDSIKSFSEREQVPQYIADEVDAGGVVVKYKGDWRIVSKKSTPYEFWDAKYKTKREAEDALEAYHANK